MFPGAPKCSMQTVKSSTEVLNIPCRPSNVPWTAYILHTEDFGGGWSMETLICFMAP